MSKFHLIILHTYLNILSLTHTHKWKLPRSSLLCIAIVNFPLHLGTLSLSTLESGGRVAYMETHPYHHIEGCHSQTNFSKMVNQEYLN